MSFIFFSCVCLWFPSDVRFNGSYYEYKTYYYVFGNDFIYNQVYWTWMTIFLSVFFFKNEMTNIENVIKNSYFFSIFTTNACRRQFQYIDPFVWELINFTFDYFLSLESINRIMFYQANAGITVMSVNFTLLWREVW